MYDLTGPEIEPHQLKSLPLQPPAGSTCFIVQVESDIVAMQGLLKKYRARLKKVKAMVKDLESQGNDYVMKNIQEIGWSVLWLYQN